MMDRQIDIFDSRVAFTIENVVLYLFDTSLDSHTHTWPVQCCRGEVSLPEILHNITPGSTHHTTHGSCNIMGVVNRMLACNKLPWLVSLYTFSIKVPKATHM